MSGAQRVNAETGISASGRSRCYNPHVYTILVVDDDPALCEVIELHLKYSGFGVLCACGVGAAAKIIASHQFDLLLTDLLMPDQDGLELIRTLRKDRQALPIVVMTGGGLLSAEVYLNIAKGLRVDGVLRKPFNMDELISLVQRLVGK